MEKTKLKLLKFGHVNCGPCRVLKPIIEEIKNEFAAILDVEDKNTYEMNPDELITAGIRAVPTMILFKDNTEVWRHVGMKSKKEIADVINKFNE